MGESEKSVEQLDLTELRALVKSLQSKFKIAVLVGTITISLLSVFGLTKLSDIENKARDRVDAAVSKGSEFFDLVVNGQTRLWASQYSTAMGYFEQAHALRPEDEYIFYCLLMCYVNNGDLDAGVRLLDNAKNAGLLDRKFNQVWTLLNAGRLYTLLAISDPRYQKSAEYYLARAQRAAELQKGGDIAYVLYARALYEYVRGNKEKAAYNITRLVSIDPRSRDWLKDDRTDPWFQMILKKYPSFPEDLHRMMGAKSN
jgi:tetratricopeptide (TPR) repeat protein